MRLWISAAVLLGFAALGLASLPRLVDWSVYRADIEAAAAELSGHEVTIGGPIDLTLLPRPMLSARDLTVVGAENAEPDFELTANQADVTLEIGPLLAGRPVIRDLRLKRPVLTITGESSRRLRSWPPPWRDWAAPVANLGLAGLGLEEGRLDLQQDADGRSFSLRDLSLDVVMDGTDGALEAAGLFRTERHSFTLSTDLGAPDRGGVRAAKLQIKARNGIDETTNLRLSGRLDPAGEDQRFEGRLTVDGPDLQHGLAAVSAATGYPSTFRTLAAAQPFTIDGEISADRTGVRAEELQLGLADQTGRGLITLELHPRKRLDVDIDLPALRLADDLDVAHFLPLDILSKLDLPPGTIAIDLRRIPYREDSARQVKFLLATGQDGVTTVEEAKAQLPGLIDVRFTGGLYPAAVGSRLRGELTAVGEDLARSLVWLGLLDGGNQGQGWRGFSLESDLDMSSVEIALNALDMRLDSASLQGDARLRFSERRRLSLDLDIDRANLDLYRQAWQSVQAVTALKQRADRLDAAIDARFRRLTLAGLQIDRGAIEASFDEGMITLDRLSATTAGDTSLSITGTIDLPAERAEIRSTLSSERPFRVLHQLDVDLPLRASRLRPVELTGEATGTLDQFEIALAAAYDGGDAGVTGEAGWREGRPWYNLRISADHPDHQALAGQFGLAPLVAEGDAEGPLELTGRLRYNRTMPWIASGNAKLGPTTFTGSLAYPEGPFTGPFAAKLSVGSPQKDSLAPLLILSGLRLTGDWTPARWLGRLPTVGLRTRWLETMEGSFSLASKGGLAGEGVTMEARLRNGLLYIEQLEARPWQGALQAEVSLERRRDQPFIAVAVTLDQVESAAFADWLGMKSGLSGPLDLRAEASSIGRTPYELVAGLAGDVQITLGPGEIRGLGVPGLMQTLTPRSGEDATRRFLTLPFDRIEADAELSRGILTFDDGRLVLGTGPEDHAVASINGTADLLLWIVDLSLSAQETDGDETDADPAPVYRIVGPPDRPTASTLVGN